MIPDHLIDQAAQALQDKIQDEYGWPRYQLSEIDAERRNERRKEARAALEAVAADIWDDGYRAGFVDGPIICACGAWNENECACGNYGNGETPEPNPYRASETA